MKTFQYTLTDPHGLHARPAAMLAKAAAAFSSQITVTAPTGTADGKRLMSLMKLGACQGTVLTFRVEGPDEIEAAKALQIFLQENL
jgi:phosphocarrier protein